MNRQEQAQMAARIDQLQRVIDALLRENAEQKDKIARLEASIDTLKAAICASVEIDAAPPRRGPGRPRKL